MFSYDRFSLASLSVTITCSRTLSILLLSFASLFSRTHQFFSLTHTLATQWMMTSHVDRWVGALKLVAKLFCFLSAEGRLSSLDLANFKVKLNTNLRKVTLFGWLYFFLFSCKLDFGSPFSLAALLISFPPFKFIYFKFYHYSTTLFTDRILAAHPLVKLH